MITANQVKELREKTGAGMMDCKKVLAETNGDEEKAIELLREREIVHFQRFGEALRGVQDKLAEKKFYMNCDNMQNSDCGCNKDND